MSRIVSVGNVVVDLTVALRTLPERGGDAVARATGTVPGGSFNTLVAARRQGLDAAYAGGHGTGPFGELVRSALAREGIDILLPRDPGLDTGYDLVMVEPDGERTFVTVFGAEAAVPGKDLGGVRLQNGDVLHVSGYGLLERTNAVVLAPWLTSVPAGVSMLVDPGPLVHDIPAAVWSAVAARADWVSCNAREARILTGSESAAAAAVLLAQGRSGGAVVRTGAAGCVVAAGAGTEVVPGFSVITRDTTGAGDAHVGAFLSALARGRPAVEAARWANAAAALAVTRTGPSSSPTSAAVAEFLRQRTAPPPGSG